MSRFILAGALTEALKSALANDTVAGIPVRRAVVVEPPTLKNYKPQGPRKGLIAAPCGKCKSTLNKNGTCYNRMCVAFNLSRSERRTRFGE